MKSITAKSIISHDKSRVFAGDDDDRDNPTSNRGLLSCDAV